MNILHISDLHFSSIDNFDMQISNRSLIKFVEQQFNNSKRLDAIFVTGDVAKTGQEQEYKAAEDFLINLLNVAGLERDRIFIVPGNHDVTRNKLTALSRSPSSERDSDDYFSSNPLLHVVHGQSNFKAFFDKFSPEDSPLPFDRSFFRRELSIAGYPKFTIFGINTAVFSRDDSDHGKLWIGRPNIERIRQAVESDRSSIKVALMHHPYHWLSSSEQQLLKTLLTEHFHLVLHGHLHNPDIGAESRFEGRVVTVGAGAVDQGHGAVKKANWFSLHDNNLTIEPLRYESSPQPIWTRDTSIFPSADSNYCYSFQLEKSAGRSMNQVHMSSPSLEPASAVDVPEDTKLFHTRSGRPIYVEPRICDVSIDQVGDQSINFQEFSVLDLAKMSDSLFIEAPIECGASLLCKALQDKVRTISNASCYIFSADELPNYQKKLKEFFAKKSIEGGTLIIDNFVTMRDSRLLNEIRNTEIFTRLIIVEKTVRTSGSDNIFGSTEVSGFKRIYIWPLDRTRIRTIAEDVFENVDNATVGAAVDKTYSDLTGLCIPLTPSNVIMYLHILWKEVDFSPLDRVHILDRYLRELLSGQGESIFGGLNAKNKIALLSEFFHGLFESDIVNFDRSTWNKFCRDYEARHLVQLDAARLFSEFEIARIFIFAGGQYCLRYGFLYSYFVGSHISKKARSIETFFLSDRHYKLSSLVEVITSVSTDNEFALTYLCECAERYISEFRERYIPSQFDPLQTAIWPDDDNEEEVLWAPIRKEVAAGPLDNKEIDSVKTSLIAESKTANQTVVYNEFSAVEHRLFASMVLLEDALQQCEDVEGDLKLRALKAIVECNRIVLQFGTVLSGILATQRYFRWGGISFVNLNAELDSSDDLEGGISPWVIVSIDRALAESISNRLGSKKLGGLFLGFDGIDDTQFAKFLRVSLLVRSKPEGWERYVKEIIEEFGRDQYRLSAILSLLRKDFRTELNHYDDSERLKNLISQIYAKRSARKNIVGKKTIGRIRSKLEELDVFGKKQ